MSMGPGHPDRYTKYTPRLWLAREFVLDVDKRPTIHTISGVEQPDSSSGP